jgi:glycine hydroxymethyltransferase
VPAPAPTAREIDYARFRRTCDRVGAKLLADMAHIAGLVAARLVAVAVRLRRRRHHHHAQDAARAARRARFSRARPLMPAIDRAVFPTLQGGPHNNNIAAIGVCLHEAAQPAFATTSASVRDNARALAQHLVDAGYALVTGGTDVHLLLVDVRRSRGVDGERAAAVCEWASIITNANTVPSDKSGAAVRRACGSARRR